MRPELLARYADQRLPRYTSYPTAPHFTGAIDPVVYRQWLGNLPEDASGSLYLHIPFCRRMCWYCGCHTVVTQRDQPIRDYLDALHGEIALVAAHLSHRLPVVHLHFGGGTPTIVAPGDFLDLMTCLRTTFDIRADAEIAIEIDPRTLTPAMAVALGEGGVTRASLGVQSLDPKVQPAVARLQSLEQTTRAINHLGAAGIDDINIDLIYGLPHQTVASCIDTVESCVALRPNRFAVFGYAHVPSFKRHQRKIDPAALPKGLERSAQAEAIAERLQAAGYQRIGLDHYALPDDPMAVAQRRGALHRNFQGYTTDPATVLLGFGASAIGHLPQGYVQNNTLIGPYVSAVAQGRPATVKGYALTDDDRLRSDIIERLMCDFRVDIEAACRAHGQSTARLADVLDALAPMAEEGLIDRDGWVIALAPEARSLVRAVAARFDAYLAVSTRTHGPAI